MQNLFVVNNGQVIVQFDNNVYTDTLENFIFDGGEALPENVKSIEYNQTLESCYINSKAFQTFPNEYAERMLRLAPVLCEAFEARKKIREEEERIEREETERIKQEQEESESLSNMTEEEKATHELEQAKYERADAVSKIIVEVDGMKFDGDEESQQRVARSIIALEDGETIPWVLYGNTIVEVTKEQLKQVLRLAGQKQTELWTVPYTKQQNNK